MTVGVVRGDAIEGVEEAATADEGGDARWADSRSAAAGSGGAPVLRRT